MGPWYSYWWQEQQYYYYGCHWMRQGKDKTVEIEEIKHECSECYKDYLHGFWQQHEWRQRLEGGREWEMTFTVIAEVDPDVYGSGVRFCQPPYMEPCWLQLKIKTPWMATSYMIISVHPTFPLISLLSLLLRSSDSQCGENLSTLT